MPPKRRAVDEAFDFFAGDGGEDSLPIEHAGNIGEIDQLIGTEIFGAAAAMWSALML